MNLRNALLLMVALVLLAAWYRHGRTGAAAVAAVAAQGAAGAAPRTGDPARPGQAEAVRTPYQRFLTSTDDAALLRDLQPAIDKGDPDALWIRHRVLDGCLMYARSPDGYRQETAVWREALRGTPNGNAQTSFLAARAEVEQRCRHLPPGMLTRQADVMDALRAAAAAGSVAAQARLTMLESINPNRGMPATPERIAALERLTVASGDPETYRAFADLAGLRHANDDDRLVEDTAWRVAACRKGGDCRSVGRWAREMCAMGSACVPMESLDHAMVRDSVRGNDRLRQRIEARVDAILRM